MTHLAYDAAPEIGPSVDNAVMKVHPGLGVVLRSRGIVVLIRPSGPVQHPLVESLLNACSQHVDDGTQTIKSIARTLATTDDGDMPGVCALVQTGSAMAVFVAGPMTAELHTTGGSEALSGSSVSTWIDKIVSVPITNIRVTTELRDVAEVPWDLHLAEGAVPGDGFTLKFDGSDDVLHLCGPTCAIRHPKEPAHQCGPGCALHNPKPAHECGPGCALHNPKPAHECGPGCALHNPKPAHECGPGCAIHNPQPVHECGPGCAIHNPQPVHECGPGCAIHNPQPVHECGPGCAIHSRPKFEHVSLISPDQDETDNRAPLPVAAEVPEPVAKSNIVLGVRCKRDHFNDPLSRFCSSCGVSMLQQTQNLVEGERPPLGILVFSSGDSFLLDGSYVLGREPDQADEVRSGIAQPLALPEDDRELSRVHAAIVVEGWNVNVVDHGSANGTFLQASGSDRWVRLTANKKAKITPGTRVRLSSQVSFVYDSHHGR